MRDGCRRRSTIREWSAEFGPYAPGYQPRSSRCKVSTQANQEPKPSPIPEPVEGMETHTTTKKKPAIPKYRSISTIPDFPPILERFNRYLSDERKQAMHTHLTQILNEYALMELEEIRLLKVRALLKGFDCQRTAFLSSIKKYYEALVKDEEDPSEDLSGEH
jgi:hypothetical protein